MTVSFTDNLYIFPLVKSCGLQPVTLMKTVACPASSGFTPAPVENLTHATECFAQLNGAAVGLVLPCYLPAERLQIAAGFLAAPEHLVHPEPRSWAGWLSGQQLVGSSSPCPGLDPQCATKRRTSGLCDPAMALVWSWDMGTLSCCSYHQSSRALCLQDAFVLAMPFLYRGEAEQAGAGPGAFRPPLAGSPGATFPQTAQVSRPDAETCQTLLILMSPRPLRHCVSLAEAE
nr:uncharacterized protein LOC106037865 [Anser cygnoides]